MMFSYQTEIKMGQQREEKDMKMVRTYSSLLIKFVSWFEQYEKKAFHPQEVTATTLKNYRWHLVNTMGQQPVMVNKVIATLTLLLAIR